MLGCPSPDARIHAGTVWPCQVHDDAPCVGVLFGAGHEGARL